MDDRQGSPPDKRMPLDKIFEAMTADLENSSGRYVQFGVSNQQNQSCSWTEYSPNHVQYMSDMSTHSNISNIPSINEIPSSLFDQDMQQYNSSTAECICFPSQNMGHLGINTNNDLIRSIDIGGGNFINVIYGNSTQFIAEQYQLSNSSSYGNNSNIDQEYGLFNDQHIQVPYSSVASLTQNSNGKQLIDNLVGNWVPNRSGTYMPFGGSSNVTIAQQSTSDCKQCEEQPKNFVDTQQRKHRTVAEIKPLKPSYSDVLSKSSPTPSFLTIATSKPIQENSMKKVTGKNLKNKSKIVVLKHRNSSGSDEHCLPKFEMPKKSFEKFNSNLSRRCVSLDDISSSSESPDLTLNMSNNFEKKKNSKFLKRNDKGETLNNFNIQNNSTKNINNLQRRPIQINNNLNTINSFSKTVPIENKIEKNKQTNNKVKDEKRNAKEKNFKHFQADKLQQIKKNQRNRKKENKDTTFKDVYKTVHKYSNRWSKIGLKIFFWLLHLISDVFSMSVNLVVQLGKCSWYYITIYVKYLWLYVLSKISQVHLLITFGKWIDIWFGDSKFAFWKRLKTKNGTDESTSWIEGLETNITLPSTGEEAMKRLLACKGKDPYSILGVTPICTDDDIKKYYRKQAFLVHPDKNNQPGAEEAFKILVHAFDIIGEPERRQAFDQTRQVEAAWGELNDLISQLHRKMEQAANTIRCTNCGSRHKRIPTQRPCYAARFCTQCKIRHSVKEGDIWAESRVMGFLWHYYACMEGAVYDVTDWAACQASNLKHLKANTHAIQYRIVLGQRPPTSHINKSNNNTKKSADSNTCNKADFEDFLNSLYKHTKTGPSSSTTDSNSMKGDNRRRKTKRKK